MTRRRLAPAGAAALLVFLSLVLSGCGAREALKGKPGQKPTPTAYGATRPQTPTEMMQPSTQARPDRNAEPLLQSQDRQQDPFDLPPR